ncbi:MAG: hypothetical protein PHF86_15235 [Candidatus Nanoarchaeia archaeon]|jgi:hypothetical protein|nr:hypothetical protein [Candidatus Nanoarchaeia archaeon]
MDDNDICTWSNFGGLEWKAQRGNIIAKGISREQAIANLKEFERSFNETSFTSSIINIKLNNNELINEINEIISKLEVLKKHLN